MISYSPYVGKICSEGEKVTCCFNTHFIHIILWTHSSRYQAFLRLQLHKTIIDRPPNKTITISSEAVNIAPGNSFLLPIMVVAPGSKLEWSFTVKDYDCQFGVINQEDMSSEDYIVDKRYFSSGKEVSDCLILMEPGIYNLVWDNSYSILRSKTIVYSISVETPFPTMEEKHKGALY